MKTIELYLNVLHFCFYKAHYKLHLFANRINPFWLLAKIPFIKKRHQKFGVDVRKEVDKAFGDKNFGLSMLVAGGVLVSLLFFLFLAGINFLIGFIVGHKIYLHIPHFIAALVLALVPSYFFVFKKEKYIRYFDKFKGWTKTEKRKYGWVTFGSITIVLTLFILMLEY